MIERIVKKVSQFFNEHFLLSVVVGAVLAAALLIFGGIVLSPGLGNM